MQKRESGIDILRCLAFFLVVLFHFFLYNGYYYVEQRGFFMFAAGAARSLSLACNALFMMLTGYLKSDKELKPAYFRSLIPVLTGYVMASAISIPIRHFLLGDVQTLGVWVNRLLSFSGVYYGWYIEMYVGLLLISPVINIAVRHTPEKTLPFLCFLLLLATSVIHRLPLHIGADYWKAAYPLTYYILGAAIKKTQPEIKKRYLLPMILLLPLLFGGITVLSTDGKFADAVSWEFGDFPVVMLSLCLFLCFYRLSPGKRTASVFQWFAGGCFEAYMLSHLLDAWVYQTIPAIRTPRTYWLMFLCLMLPVFFASLLAGKALHAVVAKVGAIRIRR